jgi:hypothetical protein
VLGTARCDRVFAQRMTISAALRFSARAQIIPGAGLLAFEDPYRILQVTIGLSRKVTVVLPDVDVLTSRRIRNAAGFDFQRCITLFSFPESNLITRIAVRQPNLAKDRVLKTKIGLMVRA